MSTDAGRAVRLGCEPDPCYKSGVTASPSDAPVVILGGGLTGLSTAYGLSGRPWLLIEREQRTGGKAISRRRDGFTFDVTGHWLHLRDDRIKTIVADLFDDGELVDVERITRVYSHGAQLHYPFQANIHGLPLEVVQECLVGLIESQRAQARAEALGKDHVPRNFEEFAEFRFGRGISQHFFVPYNTKLWGMHPNTLTADWVSRFVPVPDVEQIVAGAIGRRQEGLGYNVSFLYHREGGIDHLPRALRKSVEARGEGEIRTGVEAEEVDPVGQRVKLAGHPDWQSYSRLVSTIPLPALIERIPAAPTHVREAASRLRWVRWRYLDVATRTAPPEDYHWVYIPERRFPFFRVGVYSNAMASMAPEGCGSLYVELEDRDREPDLPEVARGLVEIGALASVDDLVFAERRDIDCAYVLFDDDYVQSRGAVLDWLAGAGVRSCGRYGAWIYNSMEDSMLQGLDAAAWAAQTGDGGRA